MIELVTQVTVVENTITLEIFVMAIDYFSLNWGNPTGDEIRGSSVGRFIDCNWLLSLKGLKPADLKVLLIIQLKPGVF